MNDEGLQRLAQAPTEPSEPVPNQVDFQEVFAEYMGTTPDKIAGYVIAVEWEDEARGLTCTSAWSANTPPWRLKGFARELLNKLEALG